jgi:hypothetical protein
MPAEERRITFDYDELYRAIFTLSMKRDLPKPPPGIIDRVILDPKNDEIIVVRITNEQKGKATNGSYSRDFIAAALMTYCRTCHIPLPKKGAKALEVNHGNIVLRVIMLPSALD